MSGPIPYEAVNRIASALERIADALESERTINVLGPWQDRDDDSHYSITVTDIIKD